MESKHTIRVKLPVNYAESESSSNRSFETSQSRTVIDLNEDEQDQIDELAEDEAPIQYTTPSRSGLRQRKPNQSLKAQENAEISRKHPRTGGKKRSVISDLIGEDIAGMDFTPVVSDRVAIRQEIASKTAANRNRFFVEKKDFWLPLLPPQNYVRKLVDKHERFSEAEIARLPPITPYEEIEVQPRGVKAVMKPYQLSGLSFMVWLHRNGLSGILGDEMGLGKTLQTLGLVQYLKENDPKAGTGRLQRPFLVVCPLSVLSSWMAEAKKWTPGLKAIRFHGPEKERTRLKKIVVGEMDIFGNLTAQAKSKLNTRRNAAGKQVILLDSDSEDELDVGVDLVVTTYECYRAEQSWFKKAFVWRYVVLDEGHTVRNIQPMNFSDDLRIYVYSHRIFSFRTPANLNRSKTTKA
jgi:SWI/SNF-related matrix-associated actin-dependent regulator of chromatin subfamily A member 5